MSWLGSVMHIMHISFPKIRVTDTVLRVFGDHMMAHKRPSLSSLWPNTVTATMGSEEPSTKTPAVRLLICRRDKCLIWLTCTLMFFIVLLNML